MRPFLLSPAEQNKPPQQDEPTHGTGWIEMDKGTLKSSDDPYRL